MSGPHINIAHNGNGTGDWIIIECEGDKEVYEGHSIGVRHLVDILEVCNGFEFLNYYELTDEQLENWPESVRDMEPTKKVRF